MPDPDTIVTGATGFIGRWLVPELTRANRNVLVLLRNASRRAEEYSRWISAHGGDVSRLSFHEFDLNAADIGLSNIDTSCIKDVYHLAARYEFGLDKKEARTVNVLGSLGILRWCGTIPGFRRFVFVTGYLAATHAATILRSPLARQKALIDRQYRITGAYEASKLEENIVVQRAAQELNIPYTIVNPSAVIGDSSTGETTQFIGPNDLVRDLYSGKLPALVGGADIFVPLVPVDHVARFMARVADYPESIGRSYWLLDQSTPNLPGLVAKIGRYLGVTYPARSVPKSLVKVLPRVLTKADPEALSFLTNLRYDTTSAESLCSKMGLTMPEFDRSLERWVSHIVSKRFGKSPNQKTGYYCEVAGARTYIAGDRRNAEVVFLHGLPLDSECWSETEEKLTVPTLRADLPGQGRNGGLNPEPLQWMKALLEGNQNKPLIVAHSLGCEYAIRYADACPDRVGGLVLISPFFLQGRASFLLRRPMLVSMIVKALGAQQFLSRATGIEAGINQAQESAAENLARPGKKQRFAKELARVSNLALRKELQNVLTGLKTPAILIAGENDPLREQGTSLTIHTIPGAGHHPQLEHANRLAAYVKQSHSGNT